MPIENVNQLLDLLSHDEDGLERLRRQLLGDRAVTVRLDRIEARLDRIDETLVRLAEAQLRSEQRLDTLTARVDALAEAQLRTEQRLDTLTARLDTLTARVDTLTARVDTLTARVDALVQAQLRTEETVRLLVQRMDRVEGRLGNMQGELLERRYEKRFGPYFGPWLARPTLVPLEAIYESLAMLEDAERSEASLLDLVVTGTPKARPEVGKVHLAIEVSAVIDAMDVIRAADRATLLRRAGVRAIPVVCGEAITEGARVAVESRRAAVLVDGKRSGWEEALEAWCPA